MRRFGCAHSFSQAVSVKVPQAKHGVVALSIGSKILRVCWQRDFATCLLTIGNQAAKFGGYMALREVVPSVSKSFVGSAVAFGVGSFFVDSVFDVTESWIEGSK